MALAGKELGKDVGQWFGPSTADGAIKCVNDTLFCPLTLTRSSELWFTISRRHRSVFLLPSITRFSRQMYTQPHPPSSSPRPRKDLRWGERAVVVLIGIRLGIDGVNPIYYDTIKANNLVTFSHASH